MTILDRILGRPEPPARQSAKAVTSLGAWGTGIPLSISGNTPQARAATYLQAYKVGWFYKAGKKIAGDIASLDWSISDGDMEEGESETTLDRPPLSVPFALLSPIEQAMRLLERPNGRQTGRQLLHKTQVRLDFAGAAAWFLEGAEFGLPTAIYGVSPSRLWPAYDRAGNLAGWVLDKDRIGGGVPFSKEEILWISTGNADDDDIWGVSVVEAVYAQVPLTDLMARHTADVLTTGGRLAGMMWPKDRSLTEDEFVDAQRAWRNLTSDPNAARRMLLFPEPMEYAAGASTPAEIGIPELAVLNRDEILTAFPVSPYRLGVPTPGGLNSGEVRREDRRDYWEETIHPRADLLEEAIQTGFISRYENATGQTYDFKLAEPNLDDAPSLLEKVAALRALASAGFDEREAVKATGLAHIKFGGIPAPDPALTVTVGDNDRQDQSQTSSALVKPPKAGVAKAVKAREDVTARHTPTMAAFLADQRDRVVSRLRVTYPAAKSARATWAAKAEPEWWEAAAEDAALRQVMARVYLDAGREALQVVADGLGRVVPGKAVDRVVADLAAYGGERIADINARTLQAITMELAEGARRGYTISQLIDGVPAEGFRGVLGVGLDNGVGVWGDARAETIARTETALSYNRAALDGYKEFRVSRVLAYDGDGDPDCAARNGREFDIDDAFSIADHPNGTLDWSPVTGGKSYDVDTTAERITEALKAIPAPVTNVYVEPAHPADVHVHNAVDVPPAIVSIGETHVAAPTVNVTVPEARKSTKTVNRDAAGRIVSMTEEP